jgi:hypothetical protein
VAAQVHQLKRLVQWRVKLHLFLLPRIWRGRL